MGFSGIDIEIKKGGKELGIWAGQGKKCQFLIIGQFLNVADKNGASLGGSGRQRRMDILQGLNPSWDICKNN